MSSMGAAPASVPEPVVPLPAPVPEEVLAATTTAVVVPPSPFESTLKIEFILSPRTLSSYGEQILTEFRLPANEKIGISRIRFKNSGTFADSYIVGLKLVNSATNEVLAKVDSPINKYIDFKMAADSAKSDKGLAVSGSTYHVAAILLTPIYGVEKPYIRLDIMEASDISTFDFNDLNRIADISKSNTFPIEGAKISAF